MSKLNTLILPASPYQQSLIAIIDSIVTEYGDAADDALYLVIEKRWQQTPYQGSQKGYISALLSDVSDAKCEFQQIAYPDTTTSNIFMQLKLSLINLSLG